jgi:DNA helicase-2/ATP-dependent DNA helicase PcrA
LKELLDSLNERQREAVLHFESPLLVLAGAGSGKTRVITYKIAYAVKELNYEPERILAVTFTNKAAREMKERISQLLGSQVPLWVSTFHSFCLRLLKKHPEPVGLKRDFHVIDTEDKKKLIAEIVKELNLDPELYSAGSLAGLISNVKNGTLSLESLSVDLDRFSQIYELYNGKLKDLNAVDFDDLLLLGRELLKDPFYGKFYSDYFRYVLIDEYQDTNSVQYEIAKALTVEKGNICVVGDEDQCIYSWRGANINNILNFEKDFKGAKVVKLEQNYRCSGNILTAANAVIENNRLRKNKKLFTENPSGEPIRLFAASDDREEANFVASIVEKLVKGGQFKYSDVAVFYRTNSLSRVIEDALRRRGIPYQIVGGVRFYERKEVKDFLSYLRAAVFPSDLLSLLRILNVPKRGLGPAVEKVVKEAFEEEKELLKALEKAKGLVGKEAQRRGIEELVKTLKELSEKMETLPPYDLINYLLSLLSYEAYLRKEYPQEWEQRLENVKELGNTLQEFAEQSGLKGKELYSEFISNLLLSSEQDQIEGEEKVVLMTVHASKGLEFPAVFVVGLEEGIFPHARSVDSSAEVEEERRLFYVAITRAKKLLSLSYAKRRRFFGSYRDTKPSRFLQEIPPHLIKRVSKRVPVKRAAPESDPRLKGRAPEPSFEERPKLVFHQKFGKGVVKRVEGSGDNAKITAVFSKVGEKTVIRKFLKVLA